MCRGRPRHSAVPQTQESDCCRFSLSRNISLSLAVPTLCAVRVSRSGHCGALLRVFLAWVCTGARWVPCRLSGLDALPWVHSVVLRLLLRHIGFHGRLRQPRLPHHQHHHQRLSHRSGTRALALTSANLPLRSGDSAGRSEHSWSPALVAWLRLGNPHKKCGI